MSCSVAHPSRTRYESAKTDYAPHMTHQYTGMSMQRGTSCKPFWLSCNSNRDLPTCAGGHQGHTTGPWGMMTWA